MMIKTLIHEHGTSFNREPVPRLVMSQSRDRAVVKTYVSADQKARWAEEAEEMGMSQSEYVATMVQAGRRELGLERPDRPARETQSQESGPGAGDEGDLEERVLTALSGDEHRSWDELVATLTADVEDRLEATLDDLQERNAVTHSGRHGGYRLVR